MRLARMTGAQALSAVREAGRPPGVRRKWPSRSCASSPAAPSSRNAEVEPSLLSLICRELNNARIAQGRTRDLRRPAGGLARHDPHASSTSARSPTSRRACGASSRTSCSPSPATARASPRSACCKALAAAGAAPDALATLVDRRLLRIEERLDMRRVELTHDVLCGVVRCEPRPAARARGARRGRAAARRAARARGGDTHARWCARGRSPRSAPC